MSLRPLSLTFLGTCSGGGPILTRNCSATALNLAPKRSWLIDCAEGTQHQMLKYKQPLPADIQRVFITHMHVDHVFGLIPLMSTVMFGLSQRNPDEVRMQLYGPSGLRSFVRNNLKALSLELRGKYAAHELLSLGDTPTSCAAEDLHENEIPGRDIYATPDGTWPSFDQTFDGWLISAGPLMHRVPSLGYVFQEPPFPSSAPPEYIAALDAVPRDALPPGTQFPRQLLSRLLLGEQFPAIPSPPTPPGRGRKVAVLGDCSDASGCVELARGADVVVHEATNACVVFRGKTIGHSHNQATSRATARGHSTPSMAGAFARTIAAKCLVMNHFSTMFPALPRNAYGDFATERQSVMNQIVNQAELEFGSPNVIAATDGLVLNIPIPDAVVSDASA